MSNLQCSCLQVQNLSTDVIAEFDVSITNVQTLKTTFNQETLLAKLLLKVSVISLNRDIHVHGHLHSTTNL